MANRSQSLDYWRKFFRSANSDIFQVIEKAILVAASDCSDEFAGRRDRIVEILYTCQFDRSSGQDRAKLEEDEGIKQEGEKEPKLDSNEPEGMNPIVSRYTYDEAEELTEIIEEERQNIGEVLRIKEVLLNHQNESEKDLFECLRRLQLMDLSVEVLQSTEIGKAVNCFRRHESKTIRHLVRALIEGWKVVVDEWMKASNTIADTPPDSINPSGMTDLGLPFPPIDEGALLASRTATIELSKIFDGMDEDGNLRNNLEFEKGERGRQRENPNLLRRQSLPCSKEKGPVRRNDGGGKPPKPQGIQIREPKPSLAGLEPPRPRASTDTRPQSRQGPIEIPKKPSAVVQDAPKQYDDQSMKAKLETAKRKLSERYQQAEEAKKQRTIQVMEIGEIPKQPQVRRQVIVKPRSNIRSLLSGRR